MLADKLDLIFDAWLTLKLGGEDVRVFVIFVLVLGLATAIVANTSTGIAAECSYGNFKEYLRGACELSDLVDAASASMDEPTKALMAENCSSALPERWLVGTWKTGKVTLTITKQGDGFVWNYDRKAGQMTKTWGEKATAEAGGRVEVIKGCDVELKGAYTAYGGSGAPGRNPIGWPMTFSLVLVKPNVLLGTGLGYGQKTFRTGYIKEK